MASVTAAESGVKGWSIGAWVRFPTRPTIKLEARGGGRMGVPALCEGEGTLVGGNDSA